MKKMFKFKATRKEESGAEEFERAQDNTWGMTTSEKTMLALATMPG